MDIDIDINLACSLTAGSSEQYLERREIRVPLNILVTPIYILSYIYIYYRYYRYMYIYIDFDIYKPGLFINSRVIRTIFRKKRNKSSSQHFSNTNIYSLLYYRYMIIYIYIYRL